MNKYTLKVVGIRQETNDTVTICFKQPGLKKIKYKAGQYLTLIFRINGRRYIRPYSFSSAPGIDPLLEVTIKRVHGGIVSNHICDKLSVGESIEVMEPMGDFTVDEAVLLQKKHVVLWGAGSGITPLFSIAKFVLATTTNKVTLVYGNRNFESVIFLEKIRDLEKAYPLTFTTWHFHTQLIVCDDHPTIIQGRIKPSRVLSIMHEEGDVLSSCHYICGPVGLKESVKASLADLQVPANQIFSDDFELVKDEKLIEDVITRTLTINYEGKSIEVEVAKGKSILDAALDANLELSYSCQTGNCSICRGRLINGNVRQIVERHPDLVEDEYQLCCTYPLSNEVEVIV